MAGNTISGTDAARTVWVAGSARTTLRANKAAHLTAPGAAPVGTGVGNTGLNIVGAR